MANEAYRAVFLRVHPTGKMVLSLTTESDGEEAGTRSSSPASSASRALDVKVVPADTDRFGVGHGYNTAPVAADTGGDPERHREDPGQGTAARGRRARGLAGDDRVGQRRVRLERRPVAGEDDRRHRAVRPRHRRAAAGRRGRAGRADGLPGSVRLGVDLDVDVVGDLQRPEQRRVGLHPERGLRHLRAAGHGAVVAGREVELNGALPAVQARARPARSGCRARTGRRSSGTRSRSP